LARARDLDTADRAACSAFLTAVREEYPQYTGILTINPDGRLFCDSLGTGRELDLRDRHYFKQASAAPGGIALEPAFGRLTGISVLQIAHPVRDLSGQLRFILLASLNLEKFVQERARRDVEILLTDRRGTVMAWWSSESKVRPAGTDISGTPLFAFARDRVNGGAGQVTRLDGDKQVWAVAASGAASHAGLVVMVGRSRDGLVAPANRRLAEEMGILILLAGVLFLGVWLLVERGIRRPVARIGAMARRLGAGDLQARIPEPHPRGELGGLMAVLNGTAASLESQHAAIEELNRKLRQSQKMEAVGQFTGGVAHDFNNLLTVILGNAEVLAEALKRQPELRQLAEMTILAAERGADLTRSLLAFARRQPLEPRALDVNLKVRKM
jgi:C4-dicarboxylate-specific signal transduction histidine kinase